MQAFHRAVEATWAVVGEANRYVDEQAPWALRKSDPERMQTVLYVLSEVIRRLAILTQPVMPDSIGRMLDLLALPEEARRFDALETPLSPGAALPKPVGIFPRFAEVEGDAA